MRAWTSMRSGETQNSGEDRSDRLALWLGAHVELYLHKLNVVCFPCAAVLKGSVHREECQGMRLERAQGSTQSFCLKGPRQGL